MGRKRVVIIGNSAAGLSALEAIRKVDRECTITIVSDENMPAYSKVLTPYLIGGDVEDIFIRTMVYYDEVGAETIFGRRAVGIREGRVILDGEQELPYDRLLIATGSSPHIPDIPGVRSHGVFALRTLDDARRISERAKSAKRALFIGGGLICFLVVGALRKRGLDISIIVSSNRILSRMLDDGGAKIVQRRLEEEGVVIRTGTDVTEIFSDGGGVRGAATSSGEEFEADIIIIAKGIRSNIEVADGSGIETSRGILVDRSMRTNLEGVYAAGDVAESPDLIIEGKRTICATWFEAVYQGEIAGYNIAGRNLSYGGSLKMNVMEASGISIASMGVTEPFDGECDVMVSSRGDNYRKLIVRNDRIVGAILVGDVFDAGIIVSLMRRKIKLSSLGGVDPRRRLEFGGVMRAIWR
ncbi:MAG: NAD(P)/FAD-dependent oxidoreductase [bacterium]